MRNIIKSNKSRLPAGDRSPTGRRLLFDYSLTLLATGGFQHGKVCLCWNINHRFVVQAILLPNP